MTQTTAAPVWLLTPDTSDERMQQITSAANGMIYCVSQKGVTGQTTNGMEGVKQYIDRVRNNTDVPLGVGFGIQSADDIRLLHGIADVAIVGSRLLNACTKKMAWMACQRWLTNCWQPDAGRCNTSATKSCIVAGTEMANCSEQGRKGANRHYDASKVFVIHAGDGYNTVTKH